MAMTWVTKQCPYCGLDNGVEVDEEAYERWRAGAFVQDAFPNLSPNQREALITGIHPKCWNKMFGEDD